MKITLILQLSQSSDDPSPNFINKLVEDFSKKNNFYISIQKNK